MLDHRMMWATLSACLVLGHPQVVAPRPGGRVQRAEAYAETLSQRLGQRVALDKNLGGWPVYVNEHGKSPRIVLSALTHALYATCVRREGGYLITRTPDDLRQIRMLNRDANRKRVGAFTKYLDHVWGEKISLDTPAVRYRELARQYLKAKETANRDGGLFSFRGFQFDHLTPAVRLLRSLVERIGRDAIADITVGEHRTFSNRPTKSERGIPDCQGDLVTYLDSAQQFLDAGLGVGKDGARPELSLPINAPLPTLHDLKLLLDVTGVPNGVTLQLCLYDARGRLVDTGQIDTRGVRLPSRLIYHDTPWASSDTSTWVTLPPADLAYLHAGPWPGFPPYDYRTADNARRRPYDFEPNDFAFREVMDGVAAKHPSLAVVALLPDSLWNGRYSFLNKDRMQIEGFEYVAGEEGNCYPAANQDWWVLRPRNPLQADLLQTDRRVLQSALAGVSKGEPVSLVTWSRFHRALAPVDLRPVASWYRHMLMSDRGFAGRLGTPDAAFQLLAPIFEKRLMAKQPSGYVTVPHARTNPALRRLLSSPVSFAVSPTLPQLKYWSTELFSDDRDRAEISWRVRTMQILAVCHDGKSEPTEGHSPESFADLISSRSQVPRDRSGFDRYIADQWDRPDTTFRLESHRVYDLALLRNREPAGSFRLSEPVTKAARRINFSKVPKSFWDEVYREYIRIRSEDETASVALPVGRD